MDELINSIFEPLVHVLLGFLFFVLCLGALRTCELLWTFPI